ncbi:MAG: tail fiber domain-containing protein, partial [Thermomicrobiales bacterium]
NTTGNDNTASGLLALGQNTTGYSNTASGSRALYGNTTGYTNTAVGANALNGNTEGSGNTAVGGSALFANTTGSSNAAFGSSALSSNTTGTFNTASGDSALYSNTTGDENTALGNGALAANSTASGNTAVGANALAANTTGNHNAAVGRNALNVNTIYSNVTGIGYNAQATGSDQVILGDGNATAYVKGGTVASISDARDKADVRPTSLGLAFISSLSPVDFRYDLRSSYRPDRPDTDDPDAIAAWLESVKLANLHADGSKKRSRFHHGFLAQDLQALIARTGLDYGGFQDHTVNGGDEQLTLGYDEFIAPIVMAIQEQQAVIESQQTQIDGLLARLSAIEPTAAG